MSSAAPSRYAAGSASSPSLSAARATLNASIESDLPRSRDERLAPAMCLGATRTIRSPRAIRNRSSAPDTCRQSSIAHTRSASSARAQRNSLPKLPLRAGTVSSPRAAAVSASTAPHVCVRLCVSVPITIMYAVPSIELTKRTPADISHSGLVPSSYQVTPVVLGRRRATRHPVGQTTGRQKVNESARRQPGNQPERPDSTALKENFPSKKVKGLGTKFSEFSEGRSVWWASPRGLDALWCAWSRAPRRVRRVLPGICAPVTRRRVVGAVVGR